MPIYSLNGVMPQLHPSVWIAPNATVIGDVVIGEGSSVWFGAVLRGDVFPIRIGARTNVQDNAVVHVTNGRAATTIGDDVTIGHSAIIHGCTVGNRCLVGMGSTVLDNAVIEEDVFVAAGSLVPPGARIESGGMAIGRPAKRVRPLNDMDRMEVAGAAALYVQYAQDHRLGLCDVTEQLKQKK
ncbi:MAG: gamma carbonic anhydrase family protein [Labilithrix sp.]|nr:gamma carbonic anhydrase family protein [Labilithrix sp.]MCW5814556.1 gamma carbonic anhydrase family protein [Labilithrix sp.]